MTHEAHMNTTHAPEQLGLLGIPELPKPIISREPPKPPQAYATREEPNPLGGRGRVLAFLRARGERGATDEEMQHEMPMSPNTQRPRRGELERGGWIVRSKVERKTLDGNFAAVWRAKA